MTQAMKVGSSTLSLREGLDRMRQSSEGVYQILLWGSKADAQAFTKVLEHWGVRRGHGRSYYVVQQEQGRGWMVVANNLEKKRIKSLIPDLSRFAARKGLTWFKVTFRVRRYPTFDLLNDPPSYLGTFIESPRNFLFIQYKDALLGCQHCLTNAKELAEAVMQNLRVPRIAVVLLSYAFEEIGKAAILFESSVKCKRGGLSAAVVERFHDHNAKLDKIMTQLIGALTQTGPYSYEHHQGLVDYLVRALRLRGLLTGDRKGYWSLQDPKLWAFLQGLGEFGPLERDYCIYVDYYSEDKHWRLPLTQVDAKTCEKAAGLVLMLVPLYTDRLAKVASFDSLPPYVSQLSDLVSTTVKNYGPYAVLEE